MEIITREEARRQGLSHFYTGAPCRKGHDSPRYVGEGKCVQCCSENRKRHIAANPEKHRELRRAERIRNADRIKTQKRASYLKNKAKHRERTKAWHEANREKALQYLRDWQANNADYCRQQKTAYYLRRKQTDAAFAVLTRLRRRINHFVSGTNKSATTAELIGCSMEEFTAHLEDQFTDGMTWENRHLWHIDHIIPCAAFDLCDPRQQRACFHYSNMRPLWAFKNQSKGATVS